MASIAEINGLTIPSSGGGFTGLLDETYGSGAAAAYSTRRLASATTVLLRVRRVTGTGNTGNDDEANFKFDPLTDDLTLSSPIDDAGSSSATNLGQFLNATGYTDADNLINIADGFVDTWTDQSGNSNDAGQNTPESQPQIFDSSSPTDLIKENGKSALSFDGSNDFLSLTSTASTNSVCQILVSVYDTSVSTLKMPLGGGSFWQHYGGNRMRIRTTSGDVSFITGLTNGDQFLCFMNANSGAYTAHLNGTSKFSGNRGSWYINQIGRGLNNNTYAFDNVIQEVILYESDQSSNRSDIETNINSDFGIY